MEKMKLKRERLVLKWLSNDIFLGKFDCVVYFLNKKIIIEDWIPFGSSLKIIFQFASAFFKFGF